MPRYQSMQRRPSSCAIRFSRELAARACSALRRPSWPHSHWWASRSRLPQQPGANPSPRPSTYAFENWACGYPMQVEGQSTSTFRDRPSPAGDQKPFTVENSSYTETWTNAAGDSFTVSGKVLQKDMKIKSLGGTLYQITVPVDRAAERRLRQRFRAGSRPRPLQVHLHVRHRDRRRRVRRGDAERSPSHLRHRLLQDRRARRRKHVRAAPDGAAARIDRRQEWATTSTCRRHMTPAGKRARS